MKNFNKTKDTALVLAYRKGNQKAFAVLVKRWHLRFCNLAFWIVKDADIAKDIAQESWSVIMHKIQELKEPKNFKSWAISIVNRKAIDWLRVNHKELIKLQEIHCERNNENIFFSVDEDFIIKEQLLASIKKLSTDHQMIIQLFYRESHSLKEISEILNISVGTTKSRLFHARENLKRSLKTKSHER